MQPFFSTSELELSDEMHRLHSTFDFGFKLVAIGPTVPVRLRNGSEARVYINIKSYSMFPVDLG